MANEKEQKPKTKKPESRKPAEKKPKDQSPKEPPPKQDEKGVLQTAAEAIGSTLGTIAVKTGIVHPEGGAKSQKIGKLPKKNKARLPRKLKKQALKKKLK